MTVRLGPRALGWALPYLITSRGMVQDSQCLFSRVRDPWDEAPSSGGEGLSPRVLEMVKKHFATIRGDFPAMRAIMLVMRVEGEEPLNPNSRGLESLAQEPSC
jgi:hypothetical protein